MTDFERSLSTALRDEAEEISMTTDTARESEKLENRLDAADRQRRRRSWAIGVGAAAAVLLAVVGATLLRSTATSTAPVSTPSPAGSPIPSASGTADLSQFVRDRTWSSSQFAVPVSLELPGWFQGANALRESETERAADWIAVDCRTKCFGDQDALLVLALPVSLKPSGAGGSPEPVTGVEQYLDHLRAQATEGNVSRLRTSPLTIDGRPATAVQLTELRTADAVFGCVDAEATDCIGSETGWIDRLAVLEVDGKVLVVEVSALEIGNADRKLETDFQELVSSIRLR